MERESDLWSNKKNEELRQNERLHNQDFVYLHLLKIGSTELFKLPSSYYEEMKEDKEEADCQAYEEIMQIPDNSHKPGGAFSIWWLIFR